MSTILSPWSDSRAWWVTRVGFLSIPVRPGVAHENLRGVTNHAQPSDQNNLCCGRPRGAMAPSELELWPRLLRWSKH